jgi:xanthine dehydrogenase accessory factor
MTSELDHGQPHEHGHDHGLAHHAHDHVPGAHHQDDHDHGAHDHGEPGHIHDAACEVAHGTVPAPVDGRMLVAVFATPVAQYLLRYGADAGYRPVLVEPDPQLAKEADANGFDVYPGVGAIPDASADVVVTDHHREELGVMLRDALATPARWVGIMGSPRAEPPHIQALALLGVAPDEVARVHRPIGLNIGSKTPPEIAIATLAGLIADRNERPGGFRFD